MSHNNSQKPLFCLIATVLLVCNTAVQADGLSRDEILTVDEGIPDTINLEFASSEPITPKMGDFALLYSVLMSNPNGERWATLTLQNTSPYQRLLDREHILATFADGEKRHPLEAEYKFHGHEEISMIINFGESKFPILRVQTSQ